MWLIEMICEMWTDGWVGKLLAVLVAILAAAAIALIGMLLFWAIDSWFMPKYEGIGTVIGKEYHEAYITTTYVTTNNTTIPVTTYHPEDWSVSLSIDGKNGDISVSQEFYNASKNGNRHNILYHAGRLSGGVYIDKIL